jgi:monosaccharide ABC transporter substrate-binding protein, CUT2 family (TC 3.A.1.2.-)
MTRRFFALFTLLIAIASLIAACGGAPTTTAPTAAPAGEPTAAPAGQPTAAPEGKKFTIGISNPFISSEYRTQMIQSLIEVNKEYMERGITNELVIESADTDVAGQIQQLQNLINKGVDAILVNPSDVNGLNDTLSGSPSTRA